MPCVHKLFSHGAETLLPPPPLYAIAALGCLSIFCKRYLYYFLTIIQEKTTIKKIHTVKINKQGS